MKDIFEILQHEKHDLALIKHGDKHLLGCKTCGKTLLTEEYIAENTEDYKKILDTLVVSMDSMQLYDKIKKLGLHMLHIDEEGIKHLRRYVLTDLEQLHNKDYLSKSNRVSMTFDIQELVYRLYKNIYKIQSCQELINICYSEYSWDVQLLAIKQDLLADLTENNNQKYKFFDNNQTYAVGCTTYRVRNTKDSVNRFFAINMEIAKELEEEYPTPLDVYKFEDINDFYDKEPDYEDEEDENYKYKEFMYRMENHLYDLTNINSDTIIQNSIAYFADFDCVDRYVIPLKKVLTEKYGIEL